MRIRNNLNDFFSRNKIIFVAFFLPVILMLCTFVVQGIFPFGENQIAVIDMYHQYVPFLSELQYKLQEGGNLFYTWNGAGGSNFWNLIAYYGASPLNLLLVFFPKSLIMEGVTFILLIKIGLSGSFMALYLRSVNSKSDLAILGFSTLYAMSSYVMAYYWCIMWIDAVALLPLCILGLNRLIENGRAVMYTVSLALIVFINYYTAIMVCIFILFYYPVMYFIKVKGAGARACVVTTGKAVGYSLLGVVMAAVMLLPTYLSMQTTYYISAKMPENTVFYNDAIDVINQMLPNAELTFREGLPNLYCGMVVVLLFVFYLLSKTISFREKALNMGFLVFLFLSLNINKLDFMWHGFHFPNQLPYRYTFVICFILIGMAYRAYMRIDEVKIKTLWTVFAVGIGYFLWAQKSLKENLDDPQLFFYLGIAWMALYIMVFILYRKGILKKDMLALLMVVLICCEMTANSCTSMDRIGTTSRDTYYENYKEVTNLVKAYDDEFARMEINDNYILNCPAFYHYKGLSQFSSSINADTTAIMEKIGLEGAPAKNRFNYNQTNPVTNAMLNVKYLIGKNLPIKDSDFTFKAKQGHTNIYENKYPLSIGYMLSDDIRTWDYNSDNPFNVLDDYVRAATSNQYTRVFNEISLPQVSSDNATVDEKGYGVWQCALRDNHEKTKVVLRYRADKTQKYYLFIETDKAEDIRVSKGGREDEIPIRNDCGSIVNIGEIEAERDFTVTIEYKKGQIGHITSHVAALDEAAWKGAYDIISKDTMKVTDFDDNYIKGKIKAENSGVFVTSVPYEKGWKLKIDGEKVDIQELTGGVFISAPLEKGTHEIELKFIPPGIILGAVITLLAAMLLALLQRRHHRHLAMSSETASDIESRGI